MSRLAPTRAEWVDAGFVSVLTLVGIYGFRAAFGGSSFFAFGALGLVLGLVLGHVTARTRIPVVTVLGASLLVAVLLGGLVLRHTALGGVLPSWQTVRSLVAVSIEGWKQLLTTLHPVGEAGNLLAIPYLLGLAAGVVSVSLLHRTEIAFAPLLPPAAVAALSILLGPAKPVSAVLQGLLFALVALIWFAVRQARLRVASVRSSQRWYRPAAGLLVLALTAAGSLLLGHQLPGLRTGARTVLHVVPPFDPGKYPSPLSEYRDFTKNSRTSVAEQTLFTVQGLGPDKTIRIATLDAYDGRVWGASNQPPPGSTTPGFAPVGGRLPSADIAPGSARKVSVTVGTTFPHEVWVPVVGVPRSVTFAGPRSAELTKGLRYNIATRTGIVPEGLQPGDVVQLEASDATSPTLDQLYAASPTGGSSLDPSLLAPFAAAATKLAGGESTPMARVRAIAASLHNGSYSDGIGYVTFAGHNIGRLATLVQSKDLVGDDEQYAAAMALLANASGVPARVVLSATADPQGVVKGSSVQAGVELNLAGLGWVPLPYNSFTPPKTQLPKAVTPKPNPQATPQVVPPPLAPLVAERANPGNGDTSPGRHPRGPGFHLPAFVGTAVRWVGPPVLLLAAFAGVVLGLKARRRQRRRTSGSGVSRVAMGWHEVLDVVRDLGHAVPRAATRREQAQALVSLPVGPLALQADAAVFGPGEPDEQAVHGYWTSVDTLRAQVLEGLPLWRRWRVQLSLASLLPATPVRKTVVKALRA